MLENKFKTKLVKEIKQRFVGSEVFHLNPVERQGAPDLLILYRNRWASLEGKQDEKSSHRPNQNYYVDKYNSTSLMSLVRSLTLTLLYPTICPFPGCFYHYISKTEITDEKSHL